MRHGEKRALLPLLSPLIANNLEDCICCVLPIVPTFHSGRSLLLSRGLVEEQAIEAGYSHNRLLRVEGRSENLSINLGED